ncbi:MAG: hypothetical protein ACHQJ7_02940 [Vicinamibacteria bacterium]|jgi:hypothetical protein
MRRQPRYPQSRITSVIAVAFVAAIVGIAIPATVTGLFHGRGLPWSEAAATPALLAPTLHVADATHNN